MLTAFITFWLGVARDNIYPNHSPIYCLYFKSANVIFQKQLKYKVAQSLDSKEYYRVYQQWRTAGNNLGETDVEASDLETYEEEVTK